MIGGGLAGYLLHNAHLPGALFLGPMLVGQDQWQVYQVGDADLTRPASTAATKYFS